MAARMPGILVRSLSSEMGERVFYVEGGRRYHVPDAGWLERNGFRWPEDLYEVDPLVLSSFPDGHGLPDGSRLDEKKSATKPLPGMLVRAPDSEFGERVFYVEGGRRHWVRDRIWMDRHGYAFPADVVDITGEMLSCFVNSGPAPVRHAGELHELGDEISSLDLREIAACGLSGTGIEFGAGASPFPVPLSCHVLYADVHSYETLLAGLYPGQTASQILRPDFVTDLQTLSGIADASLDFVVACHVIEHTVSPITAIASCHRALRKGGKLLLVVPDMDKSFDRNRELTPLQHLIDDHQSPSRERDRSHFIEFYTKVFPPDRPEDIEALADRMHAENFPIHYHCWRYESFLELLEWINRDGDWSHVWSHRTLDGAENIEFYFVLTK